VLRPNGVGNAKRDYFLLLLIFHIATFAYFHIASATLWRFDFATTRGAAANLHIFIVYFYLRMLKFTSAFSTSRKFNRHITFTTGINVHKTP
jgi:hypothetical protein